MTQKVFLDNEREPSSPALPVSCWLACVTGPGKGSGCRITWQASGYFPAEEFA